MTESLRMNSDSIELFHYTSAVGFKKILETQKLRLSHYKALNDQSEFIHINRFIVNTLRTLTENQFKMKTIEERRYLRNKLRKIGIFKYSDYVSAEFINTISKVFMTGDYEFPPAFDPYVFSFCTHDDIYDARNGLLSQWRAYGRSGYCLVFKQLDVINIIKKDTNLYGYTFTENLSNVHYLKSQEEFAEKYNDLSQLAFDAAASLGRKTESKFSVFVNEYVKVASTLKHYGFREEKEKRIVLSPMTQEQEKIFRGYGAVMNKKFKNIEILDNKKYIYLGDQEKIPISRIIVAPGTDQQERTEIAREIISRIYDTNIEVHPSETPFIG